MKRHHIADALTATEFLMAGILIGMTFFKISANWAVWVFATGELCDAFDGICARRWPYPDDGKARWWREPTTIQILEHTSDILLLTACALFLIMGTNRLIRALTLVCGLIIACICALVEVELQTDDFYLLQPERTKEVILWRRKIYLVGIILGVAFLIFATSWRLPLKLGCCLLGICIGIFLVHRKRDRLKDI